LDKKFGFPGERIFFQSTCRSPRKGLNISVFPLEFTTNNKPRTANKEGESVQLAYNAELEFRG